jgi:hypothetical protein
MLGQWAMVPDQRGVVGDRRSPSRPLMPFGPGSLDQPGRGGDRRRPSQPFKPFATPGPTPLPTPAPIPLTNKKVASGAIVAKAEVDSTAGEIPPVKRAPTPGPKTALALEPTLQVKLNPDGTPVELPLSRRATPAPLPALASAEPSLAEPAVREPEPAVREPEPAVREPEVREPPPPELPPRAVVRASKTPIPSRVTPAAAFDAIEADFFAREADLYKRDAVDTFDDLDPGGGGHDSRPSSKNRRKRK